MFLVIGLRLGAQLHTAHGLATNGAINEVQRDDLKSQGYRIAPSQGVPAPRLTTEEQEEARAADKILGITRDGSVSQLQKDIDKGMSEILAPLKKRTYFQAK